MENENYLFYKMDNKEASKIFNSNLLNNDLIYYLWKPKHCLDIYPSGFSKVLKNMRSHPIINLFYWRMLGFSMSFKKSYAILIIKEKNTEEIIHFNVVLPKNYRSPFLKKNDLILGPVWTHEKYRKKGILRFSISYIYAQLKESNRAFWWVCNEENKSSRYSIEKIGFSLIGEGTIKNNNKIKIFSYFNLNERRKIN